MTTAKFIRKTAVKVIIFACVMLIVTAVLNSLSPIVSNNLALGQMENSDEMYILMNTYNNIKSIGNTVIVGICLLFAGNIIRNSYKFYKNIKEKNENEEV